MSGLTLEYQRAYYWKNHAQLRNYFKAYYKNHKSKYVKYHVTSRANQKKTRLRYRKRLWDLKTDKPCVDCGVSYPPYVMDFDHRDRSAKRFNLSKGWNQSWESVELEMNKCDLVCSNCHRIRTFRNKLPTFKLED